MARSIKKGFFVDYHLLEKIEKATKSGAKKPIQTWSKRGVVRGLHFQYPPHAEAKLDGGSAAEVAMSRFSGATGKGTTVIKNMKYFAAARNDGFNIMPVDQLAYRRGPKPAPFEFRGTSGWTITIDMDSRDVVAAG
jgi:hypothetical protein